MSLRSNLGMMRRQMWCSFHIRATDLGNRGPLVSFTFDDVPRSAYLTGGAILNRYSARGTYYVAPGLLGTSNHLGEHFQIDDLRALMSDGHEVASHTHSHLSCRETRFPAFRADVKRGRDSLRELLGREDSGNFAYPYGEVTLEAKKNLGPQLTSCRGTCVGINGPSVDLNLLRANPLYGGSDQFGRVDRLIAENTQKKGWLIFYSHDVQDTPSRYGCTPELLEHAIKVCVEHGSRLLPVADVLAELQISRTQHAA